MSQSNSIQSFIYVQSNCNSFLQYLTQRHFHHQNSHTFRTFATNFRKFFFHSLRMFAQKARFFATNLPEFVKFAQTFSTVKNFSRPFRAVKVFDTLSKSWFAYFRFSSSVFELLESDVSSPKHFVMSGALHLSEIKFAILFKAYCSFVTHIPPSNKYPSIHFVQPGCVFPCFSPISQKSMSMQWTPSFPYCVGVQGIHNGCVSLGFIPGMHLVHLSTSLFAISSQLAIEWHCFPSMP